MKTRMKLLVLAFALLCCLVAALLRIRWRSSTRTTRRSTTQATTENLDFLLAPKHFALERQLEMVSQQSETAKRYPTTFIIGVRKAGTRALLAILNIHPQMKSCGRELHYFDHRYTRGLNWYLQQFPRISADQQTIEITPSYFVVKHVPQRVFAYSKTINKTLKFLVIFRDPTVRAISDYLQQSIRIKTRHNKNLEPFEEFVTKNRSTGINTSLQIIKIGVYSKHLARWFNYFPSDSFHFVSGEQLVKEPFDEIKKVELFLKLRPFYTENNFVFNTEKGFPCFRGPNKRSRLRCLGKTKGRSHPVVDSNIINKLRRYYHPFNKLLYKMVNRNFHWP